MVTIPLANPYETRVLPAVVPSTPRPPITATVAPPRLAHRRLALQLQGNDWLEIWDDHIATRNQTFNLDESFNAEVTRDWRAPLTVEAPFGLALRDERGRWNIYIPLDEDQIWQAASVLRNVCVARGLDVPDLEPDALTEDMSPVQGRNPPASMPMRPFTEHLSQQEPALGQHVYDHDYTQPQASVIYHPAVRAASDTPNTRQISGSTIAQAPAMGMNSDIVLAAIVHLSVLFLPVILPVTVWLALRRTVPWVAGHAREAARYQAVVWCLGALLLGVSMLATLLHGSTVATVGLLAFITLLAGAGVYAFYAVLRATNGHSFGYLDPLRRTL